jgi:lipoprotein-anchoring transpeptidase ErfK/SrfK
MPMTRRTLVYGAPLFLAGCAVQQTPPGGGLSGAGGVADISYESIYGAIDSEPFPVEAIDLTQVAPQFLRQEVFYRTHESPGTVVVDPNDRFLYLIQGGDRALRYGVGVGRVEAFNFRGEARIGRKAEWPRWTPTPDMIAREPERYGPYSGGMAGGEGNPLGARALYLYKDGRDTHYRLHGTIEPTTIGTKVSSGCVRLMNQDIIDLYRHVPIGAKVVVLPAQPSGADEASEPPGEEAPAYPREEPGYPRAEPAYPREEMGYPPAEPDYPQYF